MSTDEAGEFTGPLTVFTPDHILDWASAILSSEQPPAPDVPLDVQRVWKYLRSAGASDARDRPAVATGVDEELDAAFSIHRNPYCRHLIRGFVLARVPPADIARDVGLAIPVVQLYETVFWDVRPRLDAWGAMAVILHCVDASHVQRVQLRVAYAQGPEVFRVMLGFGPADARRSRILEKLMRTGILLNAVNSTGGSIDSPQAAALAMRNYIAMRKLDERAAARRARSRRAMDKVRRAQQDLGWKESALRERAEIVAEHEKELAIREEQLARLAAQVRDVARQNAAAPVAATHLASLRPPEKPSASQLHVA